MPAEVKKFKDLEDVGNEPLVLKVPGPDGTESVLDISAIGLRELSMAKRHMRSLALQAYDEHLADLSVAERPALGEQRTQRALILREHISDTDLLVWWNTLEGMHYWVWQSLHIKQPKITLDDVEALVTDPAMLESISDMVATISGLVEVDEKGKGEDGTDPTVKEESCPSGRASSQDSSDSTAVASET